ncbi:hypothetical protein CEXT_210151 [Caerostris extrusa]|uniref:Uncharacterized protein n=1 Tax=Caerostris extrusa TaxID=172846 RepID=A0AAV4X9K5_CAEEX|nr:hypothetical protein CEXT_210151 [Caerostris extrusa]
MITLYSEEKECLIESVVGDYEKQSAETLKTPPTRKFTLGKCRCDADPERGKLRAEDQTGPTGQISFQTELPAHPIASQCFIVFV